MDTRKHCIQEENRLDSAVLRLFAFPGDSSPCIALGQDSYVIKYNPVYTDSVHDPQYKEYVRWLLANSVISVTLTIKSFAAELSVYNIAYLDAVAIFLQGRRSFIDHVLIINRRQR